MELDYSNEQHAVKDQVRRVMAQLGSAASRRDVFEARAPFNRALWEQAGQLGWTATAVPEAYGGLELGHTTLCAIAEELGRGLAPLPFSSSIFLAVEALLLAGSEAQKTAWLPALAAGKQIGTFAVVESAGAIDATKIECRYAAGKLNGTKIAVPDGAVADVAIVAALSESDGHAGLFLVRLDNSAVRIEPQPGMDPSRPLAALAFTDAPAEPLRDAKKIGRPIERLLVRAAVMTAFEQLGGAEAALEMSKAYAKERYAFGRPIGSFQAIKHRLADVYVSIELARSQAYHAAWALESGSSELPVAAASARLMATAAFEQAARDLIQVHGGIGMTWEHDCHLFYRRSRHLALILGDRSQWRETLLSQIVDRPPVRLEE